MVADGNDPGANAPACKFWAAAGDLLRGGGYRLGASRNATHQLDVAAGRLKLRKGVKSDVGLPEDAELPRRIPLRIRPSRFRL